MTIYGESNAEKFLSLFTLQVTDHSASLTPQAKIFFAAMWCIPAIVAIKQHRDMIKKEKGFDVNYIIGQLTENIKNCNNKDTGKAYRQDFYTIINDKFHADPEYTPPFYFEGSDIKSGAHNPSDKRIVLNNYSKCYITFASGEGYSDIMTSKEGFNLANKNALEWIFNVLEKKYNEIKRKLEDVGVILPKFEKSLLDEEKNKDEKHENTNKFITSIIFKDDSLGNLSDTKKNFYNLLIKKVFENQNVTPWGIVEYLDALHPFLEKMQKSVDAASIMNINEIKDYLQWCNNDLKKISFCDFLPFLCCIYTNHPIETILNIFASFSILTLSLYLPCFFTTDWKNHTEDFFSLVIWSVIGGLFGSCVQGHFQLKSTN